MFLGHFVGKKQLTDLSVSGTFVRNGLNISFKPFTTLKNGQTYFEKSCSVNTASIFDYLPTL